MSALSRTLRQKEALARDLRDMVIKAGISFGLLGALWWGIKHPEHAARCSKHGPANVALQHCTRQTITLIATHWGVIVAVGAGVGTAAGLALAMLVRVPGRA
jgi:hypothetical protein